MFALGANVSVFRGCCLNAVQFWKDSAQGAGACISGLRG